MREWYLSSELVGLRGMANSLTGVTQKAKRNNWLSRKSMSGNRALEYHISNFHPDVKKQLIEKYVTDPKEAMLLMALDVPIQNLVVDVDGGQSIVSKMMSRLVAEDDGSAIYKREKNNALTQILSILGNHSFSDDEKELFKRIEAKSRSVTDDSGENLASNVTEIPNVKSVKEVSQMNEMCAVPVYNVYASCGFGALGDTEYQIRTEFLPCDWLKRFGLTEEIARIIECHGDSMEDTLSDGDEVLVDTRELEHPVKHGVYVVRIGKHVYIKRLKYDIMAEGYEVISDNKELYEPFIVNGDKLQEFSVIGKVVTTVMKAVV